MCITFSDEAEVARVQNTIAQLQWFQEHGYPDGFAKLPQDITAESDESSIRTAVAHEYDAEKFERVRTYLEQEWPGFQAGFKAMQAHPGYEFRDEYQVVLTCYGSGGSYDPSTGELTINVQRAAEENRLPGVIVHEIIHTSIQHLVDRYRIVHWRKEAIVDLLLERYFPTLHMRQRIPMNDLSVVEEAFNTSFPDIIEIAKKVGTDSRLTTG